MQERDRNRWAVYLGSAWPGGEDDAQEDVVAVVDQEKNLRYEVTVVAGGGKPRVGKIAMIPLERDGTIDQGVLDSVPLGRIAKLAEESKAGLRRTPPDQPLTPDSPLNSEMPTPTEVAAHWRAGWGREQLAREYWVSVKTADVWIRRARDQGLIEPARTGRPRARQQQQPPRTKESE